MIFAGERQDHHSFVYDFFSVSAHADSIDMVQFRFLSGYTALSVHRTEIYCAGYIRRSINNIVRGGDSPINAELNEHLQSRPPCGGVD